MTGGEWLSDQDLSSRNTLGCPSVAEKLVYVRDRRSLETVIPKARSEGLPIRVLGDGSNVVLPQRLGGLTVLMEIPGLETLHEGSEPLWRVGAGVNWHWLVCKAAAEGLWGIENLALIPGKVGAAPIQNIGAFGAELSDVLEGVEVYDCRSGRYLWLDPEDCRLGYRHSLFKEPEGEALIITRVDIRLRRDGEPRLSYGDLERQWKEQGGTSSPQGVLETICRVRQSRLPDPGEIPNAGSFFKNPIVDGSTYERLVADHPSLSAFSVGSGQWKLAAGWLIEQAGWKGKVLQGVGCYEKQALVLINPGRRTADEVLARADAIRQDVRNRFGVELEQEPRILS